MKEIVFSLVKYTSTTTSISREDYPMIIYYLRHKACIGCGTMSGALSKVSWLSGTI